MVKIKKKKQRPKISLKKYGCRFNNCILRIDQAKTLRK